MEKEIISLKGNREKWQKFAIAAKIRRTHIWDILEPMIDKYIKNKGG